MLAVILIIFCIFSGIFLLAVSIGAYTEGAFDNVVEFIGLLIFSLTLLTLGVFILYKEITTEPIKPKVQIAGCHKIVLETVNDYVSVWSYRPTCDADKQYYIINKWESQEE